MRVRNGIIVAGAALGVSLAAPAARAGAIDVQYAVSLAGLSLGTATLKGNVTAKAYTLNAGASLSGLAGMVTGGRGSAVATGVIDGRRTIPANYSVTAANSEMTRTLQMGVSGGAVQQVVINPPLDEHQDRVAVTAAHKLGIADPLGAMLMPTAAAKPEDACNRTIPVFDGAQRFDIQLSYAGTRTVAAEDGYAGPVMICKVRYTPIAGHRPSRKSVQYMAANRDMEAWLAPSGVEGVYLPFRIAVKTQIGTTVVQATRYRFEQSETTASIPRR